MLFLFGFSLLLVRQNQVDQHIDQEQKPQFEPHLSVLVVVVVVVSHVLVVLVPDVALHF